MADTRMTLMELAEQVEAEMFGAAHRMARIMGARFVLNEAGKAKVAAEVERRARAQ